MIQHSISDRTEATTTHAYLCRWLRATLRRDGILPVGGVVDLLGSPVFLEVA